MNERDKELEPLLSSLRDGPFAISSPEAAAQRRARVLGTLRAEVRKIPRRAGGGA